MESGLSVYTISTLLIVTDESVKSKRENGTGFFFKLHLLHCRLLWQSSFLRSTTETHGQGPKTTRPNRSKNFASKFKRSSSQYESCHSHSHALLHRSHAVMHDYGCNIPNSPILSPQNNVK